VLVVAIATFTAINGRSVESIWLKVLKILMFVSHGVSVTLRDNAII